MRSRLLIAAGGGGDDLAAVVLQRATAAPGERAHFASYSWERLFVDPVPGPRDPSWFKGLERVGAWNYRVTPEAVAIAPAHSLLPRLVSELEEDFYLLDPREGVWGLARQLAELTDILHIDRVQLVDVGGDILAEGHEEGLRSPLADALTLAAANPLSARTDVLVAGAGLDGELSEQEVLQRLASLKGQALCRLATKDAEPFVGLLDWYPSDVTGLLIRAATGFRGIAELRDGGLRASLSEQSPIVWRLRHHEVFEGNGIGRALAPSRSLDEAEALLRGMGKDSDIDYERQKAGRINGDGRPLDIHGVLDWLEEHETELASRCVDFMAIRRIIDSMELPSHQIHELREELRKLRHPRYAPPVWVVNPEAVPRASRDTRAGNAGESR